MIMQPRGIRNHNPGNLRVSESNHWQGRADWHQRTPEQRLERAFEVFVDPEHGIRALAITLVSYYDRHGLTNLRGLIGRWAPQAENDTASYVLSVARRMSTDPSMPLDLHDYDVMRALVVAIIVHENGMQPYPDAVIDKGLALAGVVRPIKPLPESRTVLGGSIAGVSTAASATLQAVQSVEEVRAAIEPLQAVLPWVQWLLVALTLAGVGLAIYARVSDQSRRLT